MAVERLNPVTMFARELKNSNLSFKQIAERLERDPGTVQVMLKKDNMSVERLIACTKALNYNFFLEIGYKLSAPGPADPKGNPLTAENISLNTQLKAKTTKIEELEKQMNDSLREADVQKRLLETELNTLKQVMKDLLASRQL
jgi:hypothetical protein